MTVKHLNYIGSKHSLLEWIHSSILEKTGYTSFQGKTIADLFAGTGVVSYHFRSEGATVLSNDIEPCSYAVTKAMTECSYTPELQETISSLNQKLKEKAYESTAGFLTKHYSPYEGCERMYFTVDNAKRIDYIRKELQKFSEKDFLLASLLVSADAIANCASVYGAYLKKFKKTAEKEFYLQPIHTYTSSSTSKTVRKNVLDIEFLQSIKADIVYLDPPYNERQYSKNYFPLSILALEPEEQDAQTLSGKTGIPSSCFTSPFCSKRNVKESFQLLFQHLQVKWIFLSYNSESLVSKDDLLEVMKPYGKASVLVRDYKRFQSQNTERKDIQEYLFCLEKTIP